MIYGNTSGIKKSTLERLENLIDNYEKHLFIDTEVLFDVADVSCKINREVCIYINRQGRLLAVGVGDASTAPLKDIKQRRGDKKLSGVRLIHTHPSASGRLSEMDMSALKALRFDAIAGVGVFGGEPIDMEVGYLGDGRVETVYVKNAKDIPHQKLLDRIYESDDKYTPEPQKVSVGNRAVLINVSMDDKGQIEIDELERLADTAGLVTVAKLIQNRRNTDKNYCAGQGKLEEIKQLIQIKKADYIIFNNMLSGSQLNNLENALPAKIIDRPMLILEIFAKHATTNEGKLQVELALMQYTLPKILGQGHELSRIGGGSGSSFTRGAGETKLETDRRNIRRKIYELGKRIENLQKERDLRRERRNKSGIKTVAIVGYTNAGKSTLMNNITKAGVIEADKLFATLDPVTRKIFYDIGKEYLLTDTVGFIDNLPHEFVDAFRSTLEEAKYADLLLHVVDASSKDAERQMSVVKEVLASLGAGNKPMIIAYNKTDIVDYKALNLDADSVAISAKTGEGVKELKNLIEYKLFGEHKIPNYEEV